MQIIVAIGTAPTSFPAPCHMPLSLPPPFPLTRRPSFSSLLPCSVTLPFSSVSLPFPIPVYCPCLFLYSTPLPVAPSFYLFHMPLIHALRLCLLPLSSSHLLLLSCYFHLEWICLEKWDIMAIVPPSCKLSPLRLSGLMTLLCWVALSIFQLTN